MINSNAIEDMEEREEKFLKTFFESIDIIRAIAIIGVILSHTNSIEVLVRDPMIELFFWYLGGIGVNIFVFLSGMLLTIAILQKENTEHSWRKWYARRILRIYPSLILSTFLVLIVQYLIFNRIYELNSILIHLSGLQSIPGNLNFFLIMNTHWFVTLILSCYIFFPILFIISSKGS